MSASPHVAIAREVSAVVLFRVLQENAYASAALDSELRKAAAGPRDAALATEIVYGTLRVLPELEDRIAMFVRKRGPLDSWVRATLLAAAYQIFHLSGVPTYASVDDAVKLVKRKRGPRVANFANAVLRKLADSRPGDAEPPSAIALRPDLRHVVERSVGTERADRFLLSRRLPPPLGLRVRQGASREELGERIRAERGDRVIIDTSQLSPVGILLRGSGDPRTLPGYSDGAFVVQEEGAQAIACLTAPQPGERIADVCAGHGGKTTWLAECVGEQGQIVAIDLYERKLERIPEELARLGIAAGRVRLEAIDMTVGVADLEPVFDKVLVDAPCTGLGTIHRRPELALRLQPSDFSRMAELQQRILQRASQLVRPGGLLFYAVCSLANEESVDVAEALESIDSSFVRCPSALSIESLQREAAIAVDDDGVLRLGPWSAAAGEADAYQVVAWRRS